MVVLYPLFDDLALPNRGGRARDATAPSVEAVQALREIEFDRETGKLSDSDYSALKTRYTREAVAAFRDEESGLSGIWRRCGRGRDSPVPQAPVGVRGVRPASGTGRDLLLDLRALSRRDLRALPCGDQRDRRAVLRKLRRDARCLGEQHVAAYSSSRSSRRNATCSGMNVQARQSNPASPKPKYMSTGFGAPPNASAVR